MHPLAERRLKERFFQSTKYHSIPGGKKKLAYLFSVLMGMKATRPRPKVLDVGCGNGGIAFAVASLGCEILGVDVDTPSIERARNVNPYPNARFEVVVGDNFDLKETFDLIICSEVLEHLYRPQALLDTMVRHLKDDGLLLITVPNGYGPREILGRTETFLRTRLGVGNLVDRVRTTVKMIDAAEKCAVHTSNPDQDHVQKFTMGGLRNLIEKAGLSVVDRANSIFIFSVVLRAKGGIMDTLDSRLADYLPPFLVSGWYLLCKKAGRSGEQSAGIAGPAENSDG
jgi:SAM-dependent methyltransferase